MESRLAKIRRYTRQAGQGMTEYIIIVAVIAVASIAVYTYFGDTLRQQTSAAATALSGQDGQAMTDKAQDAAKKAEDNSIRRLDDFSQDRNN
jgi:Flp pilus assembly pilin Flp